MGDALYVQAIARELVSQGEKVEVCCNWPEVFSQLNVNVSPFTRQNIDILAHYSKRKFESGTQFDNVCTEAGVKADLRLDWEVQRERLFPKRMLLVYMPRTPMDRNDHYGRELFPNCERFDQILEVIKPHFYTVLVGKGKPKYDLGNIDLDLVNKTSVTDLIDLAKTADRLIGQVSGMIPLAESFNKKCLAIWSSRGLECGDQRISSITPRKICHKSTSYHVIDNQENIEKTIMNFL